MKSGKIWLHANLKERRSISIAGEQCQFYLLENGWEKTWSPVYSGDLNGLLDRVPFLERELKERHLIY